MAGEDIALFRQQLGIPDGEMIIRPGDESAFADNERCRQAIGDLSYFLGRVVRTGTPHYYHLTYGETQDGSDIKAVVAPLKMLSDPSFHGMQPDGHVRVIVSTDNMDRSADDRRLTNDSFVVDPAFITHGILWRCRVKTLTTNAQGTKCWRTEKGDTPWLYRFSDGSSRREEPATVYVHCESEGESSMQTILPLMAVEKSKKAEAAERLGRLMQLFTMHAEVPISQLIVRTRRA